MCIHQLPIVPFVIGSAPLKFATNFAKVIPVTVQDTDGSISIRDIGNIEVALRIQRHS